MAAVLSVSTIDDGFFPVLASYMAQDAGVAVTVEKGAAATTLSINGQTVEGNVEAARALIKAAAAKDASYDIFSDASEEFVTLAFTELYNKKDTVPQVVKTLNEKLTGVTALTGDKFTFGDAAVFACIHTNKRWPIMVNKQKAAEVTAAFYTYYKAFLENEALSPIHKAAPKAAKDLADEEAAAKAAKLDKSKTGSFDIDLPGAEMGKVVTRFPPEPSGYLHIGHAKALLLNNYFAERFKGKMILRFDDTNPSKEKDEYVENIMADLKTLEVTWVGPTYTSDYFDLLLDYGRQLIREGKAYVDATPVQQMREERLKRIESAARNNSVEENLRLFEEMVKGSEEGLQCCARAKIDMQSDNGCMRDPTIFRCNLTPHHRTGSKYKVYPTYDFCCPIVDSIEGVTHTLRTIEYHDRNHQYNWVCDALNLRRPHIWDFSRLNFVYTLLSKRKLQWFVDNNLVEGWFDPRFPTVQGIIRRGLTVESLKAFMISQGASKNINLMEWDKLWALNKSKLEPVAHRYNALAETDLVTVELTDLAETTVITAPLHMKNAAVGTKQVVQSREIVIEQADAAAIADGEEITLINWGNIICEKVERDATGKVVKIVAKTNFSGDVKSTSKKITWIGYKSKEELVPLELVEYGPMITERKIEEEMKVEDIVNYNSKEVSYALGEAAMTDIKHGQIFQIQRKGFYRVDAVPTAEKKHYTLIYVPDGTKRAQPGLKQ